MCMEIIAGNKKGRVFLSLVDSLLKDYHTSSSLIFSGGKYILSPLTVP